jgi:hypothetical protein
MLTPQGMRQRYLLGKYNKFYYMDRDWGFNKTIVDFRRNSFMNLTVESSIFYRTIQSGYSELLGFIDDGNSSDHFMLTNN